MTRDTTVRWRQPGYADIVAVAHSRGDIEVEFANGDVVVVPASALGVGGHVVDLTFDPEEAMSLEAHVEDGAVVEISWTQIRTATDPEFAQEMRRRDEEQARRLGLRLKALREDQGLSQRDLAQLVGMSPPQLSKIESGTFDLRVSTVQTLLRAMGATFADVADPEAPEVSQNTIRKHAIKAGVPKDLMDRLFAVIPRRGVLEALEKAFRWTPEMLAAGALPGPSLSAQVRFKATQAQKPEGSPLVHLAHTISQLVARAADLPSGKEIPADPAVIREQALTQKGAVTLVSLLRWTWGAGVPVIPVHGSGGFFAAAWEVDQRPAIVLKDGRNFAVYWLFDLAHELGHIARGHIEESGIVDVDSPSPHGHSDQQEEEASDFALGVLLPNHDVLLERVRDESRGSYLRFKGAVETVAHQARVSPSILGMVAAYELTEIGEAKDRWGSATNLSRPEGAPRPQAQHEARKHILFDRLSPLDKSLLEAVVFADESG